MNETYRPSSILPLTLLLLQLPSSFNVAAPATVLHSFNNSAPGASAPSIHRCLLLQVPLQLQVPFRSIPSTEVEVASAMSLHVLPVQFDLVNGTVLPHGRWQGIEVPISDTTVPASVVFCLKSSNTILHTRRTRSTQFLANVHHELP